MNIRDFKPVSFIPEAMRNKPNWILWRLERNDAGLIRKVPYTSDGHKASSNRPTDWHDYKTAAHVWETSGDKFKGIGFMLGKSNLVFIDLDDAINDAGEFNEQAVYVMETLKDSAYCELSQSGSGLHFFVKGSIPRSFRNSSVGVEMYSGSGHYAAMTGKAVLAQEPGADPAALRCIFNRFKTKTADSTALFSATHGGGSLDDDAVIRKAAEAPKSGENFKALFSGDWSGYSSRSEADLRLCQLLAFWTNKDPGQVDRIFRSSGLMRPKWERVGYRQRTITRAISSSKSVSEWIEERERERQDRVRRITAGYVRYKSQLR